MSSQWLGYPKTIDNDVYPLSSLLALGPRQNKVRFLPRM